MSKPSKGKIEYSDGSIYEGELLNGEPHGMGVIIFNDGAKYEGQFVHEVIEGEGVLTIPGSEEYRGQFVNGERCGRGVSVSLDGSGAEYDGEWLDGKRHGRGREVFDQGFIFEGEFFNNRPHGEVTQSFRDGTSVHAMFHDGVLIPVPRESPKPDRVIVILGNEGLVTDLNPKPAIVASYGIAEDQVKIMIDESDILPINELICRRKGEQGNQVVIHLIDHGYEDGAMESHEFIFGKLGKILEKIKEHNDSVLDAEKIHRIKLNLNVCFGDKCVMNPDFLGLINAFTDAGIEVRTSAIAKDSRSLGNSGNGKNLVKGDGRATTIVERLFSPSMEAVKKFEDKSQKYNDIRFKDMSSVEEGVGPMFCASAAKFYKTAADLILDRQTFLELGHRPEAAAQSAAVERLQGLDLGKGGSASQ